VIVSYRHEDDSLEEVDTDDLSTIESAAIESATGLEWSEVETALQSETPTAMRAVLWVFRKRQQPTLRFKDFDIPGWRRRLKASRGREEILELVETLRANEEAADDEDAFDKMLGYMRTLAHDPADVDWALEQTAPKAPEPAAAAERPAPVAPSEESAATS
jgi:hypothetical protein